MTGVLAGRVVLAAPVPVAMGPVAELGGGAVMTAAPVGRVVSAGRGPAMTSEPVRSAVWCR
ncbi:MAG: hypothetical protein ACE367_18965 [Acidimicrobiales bacterium]